jgi:peroxiredoxin
MDEPLQPLSSGTPLPHFALPSRFRVDVSVRQLRGARTVLVFYPFDWEPVSRQQLSLYQDYLVEFERWGATIVGISIDHAWSHEAFARQLRIRFPLLSDSRPRGMISQLFGVYRKLEERSARALFVTDDREIVRFSAVYPDELNPGVNDILLTLEALASDHTDTGEARVG